MEECRSMLMDSRVSMQDEKWIPVCPLRKGPSMSGSNVK